VFGNIGPLEIGIVLVIALVVFGPKRLPELGSSLGRGIREFKETVTNQHSDKGTEGATPELTATQPTETPVPGTVREHRG
jgi:sec-independent protein translocase protein TatA